MEKKLLLEDSELTTPKHDEMVLWAFNNYNKILDSFEELSKLNAIWNGVWEGEWDERAILWDWEKRIPYFDGNPSEKVIEKMKQISINYDEFMKSQRIYNMELTIEHPLKGYNGFNLGFLDLLLRQRCGCYREFSFGFATRNRRERDIIFEIKPNVRSIGETLRQLQFYKSNYKNSDAFFILVTQTKGLKEIFASQGFFVYEYEESKKEGGEK